MWTKPSCEKRLTLLANDISQSIDIPPIPEMDALDDFEIIEYDPYSATPQERKHYKDEVHPHGQVPAMVTSDGEIIIESAAICLYLAQLYGKCLPDEQNEANYFRFEVTINFENYVQINRFCFI